MLSFDLMLRGSTPKKLKLSHTTRKNLENWKANYSRKENSLTSREG
jgi:hypothetical protein